VLLVVPTLVVALGWGILVLTTFRIQSSSISKRLIFSTMSCKIIEAILDTVSTTIITAAIRTKPSDEPSLKPSSMPSLQPLLQPSSELLTKPSSKPSGEPSSKPSLMPYIQPSLQPSSESSIKPSSKPSDEPSSKPSSTKLLEGLASLGSSLDLSLGMLGLFLESPGEQSQSYVW
jgi:hypothetical protein